MKYENPLKLKHQCKIHMCIHGIFCSKYSSFYIINENTKGFERIQLVNKFDYFMLVVYIIYYVVFDI